MNAQCAKCGTQIRVDESKLGERGAKIRCPRCANTVIVERPRAAAAAFDASALDPSVVGGGPSLGAAGPEPELLGDEDLLFADADLVGAQGASRPGSAPGRPSSSASRSAKSSTWNVATRVGVVPPIVKAKAESAARGGPAPDDSMLAGGLAADGTFTPPPQSRPGSNSGAFDNPQTVTRAISLKGSLAQRLAESGAFPRPTRQSVVAPVERSPLAVAGTIVGSLLAMALLGFGILVFLGGGRVDARLLRLESEALAAVWSPRPLVTLGDLRVVAMRSVLYPTRSGGQVLVFFGEVHNAGSEARQRVLVRAELRDPTGRLVATARAPLGVALGPAELHEADDPARLAAFYEERGASAGAIAPGATAPFAVVVTRPPPLVERLQHAVALAHDDAPAPAPSPAAVIAAPETPPSKGKARGKAKGKGKPRQREAGEP